MLNQQVSSSWQRRLFRNGSAFVACLSFALGIASCNGQTDLLTSDDLMSSVEGLGYQDRATDIKVGAAPADCHDDSSTFAPFLSIDATSFDAADVTLSRLATNAERIGWTQLQSPRSGTVGSNEIGKSFELSRRGHVVEMTIAVERSIVPVVDILVQGERGSGCN